MRLAFLLTVVCAPVAVVAHPLAPSLLVLREGEAGRVEVEWKMPVVGVPGPPAMPVLPSGCRETTPRERFADLLGVRWRWTVACAGSTLVGAQVGIESPGPAGVVVRIVLRDGRVVERLLRAADPWFTVPAQDSAWDTVRSYVGLGVQHILGGPDHLLFVFGLVLLGGTFRRVVTIVTAFTVGHSLTLAAAVLGLVSLPAAPIEVAIAASVFLLAVELARDPARPSLLRRRPWMMAMLFGLLHGLGFAAALIEAGLPREAIPAALFGFNAGIEIGQVAFVAVVLAIRALIVPRGVPMWVARVPIYVMGALSAFWMLERTLVLFR